MPAEHRGMIAKTYVWPVEDLSKYRYASAPVSAPEIVSTMLASAARLTLKAPEDCFNPTPQVSPPNPLL